jgi:hypothetical protein
LIKELISEDDAIAWLGRDYRMPRGVAEVALQEAVAKGYILIDDVFVDIIESEGDLPKVEKIPPRISALIPDKFTHRLELDFAALRWQIR